MQRSVLLSRPVAIAGLTVFAIVCLVSLGESLKVLASSSVLLGRAHTTGATVKRSWESEQGPFSPPRPEDLDGGVSQLNSTEENGPDIDGEFGLPGLSLPNPLATAVSIVGCLFHGCSSSIPGAVAGNPTQPPSAVSVGASQGGGGLFPSVLSILAGSPDATPAPGSPGGSAPLGGLLSALSQAAPSSSPPAPGITAPPAGPAGSGDLFPALGILDGVASALNGVLGSPDESDSGGSGLLGQLSANILDPIASIAADPVSILANPSAAISNLQSQVSNVLNSMPSAVAAGVQLASNVGGDLADALNATTDLLDSVPDVAGGVAGQVGSLLNAAPTLATGIPSAALDAVNQVGAILNGVAGIGDEVVGILGGLKNDLSNAVASAIPEVSALAGVVQSQVVGVLPSALQPLVSGALSSLATAPAAGNLLPGSGQAPTASPHLASLLSSLSSSIISASPAAAVTDTAAVNSIASSALSGLSSLISQISQLSLTAVTTPPPSLASATAAPIPSPQPAIAQTTIYYVQTITALITSTSVQTSVVTVCPTAFASYTPTAGAGAGAGAGAPLAGPGGSPFGSGGSPGDGSDASPCPGQGYTCDSCADGWFCPPVQTPALPAPCGYGWPCYHCDDGWFCVPSPQTVGPGIQAYSTSRPGGPDIKALAIQAPDTNGYQYVGCYKDNPDRALRDAQLLTVAGGMTTAQCVDFCSVQGFPLAGTEYSTQCFCGYMLLDSIVMDESQCNMSCAGDSTNTTMCGGPWALGIWSVDGSVRQGDSPENQFTLATTPGWQITGGVRYSRTTVATPIWAWPPFASSPSPAGAAPSPTMDMSGLESAILSAVAAEAGGMALLDSAAAGGIIESVSMILNQGMSSIANVLSLTTPAINTPFISGPTNIPLGPGPVVPSTAIPTATTLLAETAVIPIPTEAVAAGEDTTADDRGALDGSAGAEDDGSYTFPILPGVNRRRRAPRHRAHWV